jgi:hypothetical protein
MIRQTPAKTTLELMFVVLVMMDMYISSIVSFFSNTLIVIVVPIIIRITITTAATTPGRYQIDSCVAVYTSTWTIVQI